MLINGGLGCSFGNSAHNVRIQIAQNVRVDLSYVCLRLVIGLLVGAGIDAVLKVLRPKVLLLNLTILFLLSF